MVQDQDQAELEQWKHNRMLLVLFQLRGMVRDQMIALEPTAEQRGAIEQLEIGMRMIPWPYLVVGESA